MSSKALTIIIPMYNTELYLSRCLDSLLYDRKNNQDLEIIIVNDGSTDKSLEIAKEYKKHFPDTVSIIDKKNGGHGSTINAGLATATGKYLKVIDSDDWVNIADFRDFIKTLKEVNEDIIVTNYQEDRLPDSSAIKFDFFEKEDDSQLQDTRKSKKFNITQITDSLDEPEFFFKFSMHSMTVKLKSLRKVWGSGLLENTFYVDQQYVAKALECAASFRLLDFDIYRYFIGRPEQSVCTEGFFRHRQDHERILRWLIEKSKNLDNKEYLQAVLKRQINLMLNTHYELYYQNFAATNEEIAELLAFNRFVQQEIPEIGKNLGAAKDIRKRLAPWRRKLKRKLLS